MITKIGIYNDFADFANFAKLGAKSFAFREILKTQKISNTMCNIKEIEYFIRQIH